MVFFWSLSHNLIFVRLSTARSKGFNPKDIELARNTAVCKMSPMLRRIFLTTLHLLALSPFIPSRRLHANEPELHVSVLSAGYADCTLFKLPNGKNMMVDAGSAESAEKILAELKARAIEVIDFLLITHFHDNHYGGLAEIAGKIKTRLIAIPIVAEEPEDFSTIKVRLISQGAQIISIRKGDEIKIDPAVKIMIMHPHGPAEDPNADSVVALVQFKDTILLFPADITPEVQNKLLTDFKKYGKIDFVLLPHHGGELRPEFADWIKDSVKVISTGPSQWTSPAAATLARFSENLHRTDLHGTLSFKTDGIKISQVEHA